MLEDLPVGQRLETPMHLKRARVLPAAVAKKPRSETLWSSLDIIAPSTPSTPCGQETPPPMPAASLSPHDVFTPSTSAVSHIEMVPSPTQYVECGGSSTASTPKTTRPVSRDRRWSNIRRPLRDDEISDLINYGSEEESGEEDDEGVSQVLLVPRVARVFLDQEDDEVEERCVQIDLQWPPQLPRLSADPTASLPPPASPSSALPSPASPTPASPSLASPPVPISMEPSDKFKFEWRAFPTPQIEPNLRREPFSQNIGPTVSFTNPYEAFTAIWDREIIELIVTETNTYAQQLTATMLEEGTIFPNSRITRWQATNVNEVYTYLAIVLAMGVVVKSRMEEYWNTSKNIFSTPGFATEMAFDRFLLLSKCLHFNNNTHCNPEILTRPQAKLFKIQPILDHLNAKFSQLYNLSQNVALDESLTMWKGWLDINQFIRNKAATVGIKTYEVCESQTGYLWRFEVHAGHDTPAVEGDPVSGIVPALVLRLLNGLEHKGHTIWMDNFYNSPALARELKVRGFDCVGTLRTNRQFVPSELASITKKDMTVGQVLGCTSQDAMYPIERRRTRVWYKKFFRRLLNASVLNSYILLNRSLSHRKFRKALVTDLLAVHRTSTPIAPILIHSVYFHLLRTIPHFVK